MDKEDNWAEIFSLGEQQRIAFLRLFSQKPTLAFVDEAEAGDPLEDETEESDEPDDGEDRKPAT